MGVLPEEKSNEMTARWEQGGPHGWRVEMVGLLNGEAGGGQIMWGTAGLLRTLDYQPCEMRTHSRQMRAGELHIINLCPKTRDHRLNNKLEWGRGMGQE